jgi:hypothetical protein
MIILSKRRFLKKEIGHYYMIPDSNSLRGSYADGG